ncbi:hypothetical protein C0995_008389 [Termitomyces sp. Mi166|nr:hypothetical protein C0995_008389 [Termitomyces sp. Mi166\
MSSSTRPRRASLAAYLSSPTVSVSLPSLPPTDLQHALNAQKYTPGNNDVLEFIGDRVVNFACTLMASKLNHSPDQQTLFARRLSNNDTLGRIAHQLRLPQHASVRLDSVDRSAAEAWSRCKSGSPPKLFADLFESYTGALFLRPGWHYTHAWLKKVYEIITAAARDAFSTTEVAPLLWSIPDAQPWPQQIQRDFEDFIDEREAEMQETTKVVMQSIPRSEVSSRRQERSRPWRTFSLITNALMSDDTLGHIGILLSLSSYLPPSDPDFLVTCPVSCSMEDKDTVENLDRTKPKAAGILKALIGAFYLRHPTRARKWGHKWLRPLVCWTMGTLLRVGRYRPIISPSPHAFPKLTLSAKDEPSKPDTAVEALLKTFEHLAIDSKIKTHKKTSSTTSNEPQKAKTQTKTKKYTIKINAPWLFSYVGTNNSAKDDEKKVQLDLDIELDPYKLLDEGGTFPAPEPEKNTPDEDEKDHSTSDLRQPEDACSKRTTDPTDGDSDGSQDMEFSSSSSGTESDMEFSSEEDVHETQTDGDGKNHKTKDKEEEKEDGLTKALERLKIHPSGTGTEGSIVDSMAPATRSEGSGSSSPEPCRPTELSRSSKISKEVKERHVESTTEEDELEDMEFSSSGASAAEDDGEKDMEFSDEDNEQSDTSNKVDEGRIPSTLTISSPKSKEAHTKDKEEEMEDGLRKALQRLEIDPSGTEMESGVGDLMTPATHSEGLSSSSSEPRIKLPTSSKIDKEEKKDNVEPTSKDELEDMEFSSSEELGVEDSDEKDMEFSSDEDKKQNNTSKVAKGGIPSTSTMPPDVLTASTQATTPSKVKKVRVPLSPLPLDTNGKLRIRQRAL